MGKVKLVARRPNYLERTPTDSKREFERIREELREDRMRSVLRAARA